MDIFSALIQKQRALDFPKGQDFNGVVYEYQINPQAKVSGVLTSYQLVVN